MNYQILTGDNRLTLKTLADNSIDAIITDPPYGIDFLGKAWDANTGALETYQECLRVLKPGGHILAFSAARTYHHLAVTLEQAGFEIRDQIMWIYSSGFPKSQDIGKQIDKKAGLRTTTLVDNKNNTHAVGLGSKCVKCDMPHGTATRGMCKKDDCPINEAMKPAQNEWAGWGTALKPAHEPIALARKPIKTSIRENVLKYGTGALNIDATRIPTDDKIQSHYNRNSGAPEFAGEEKNIVEVDLTFSDKGRFPSNVVGEIPDYQKYFYCPKVSRKERHMEGQAENNHPTVKPIELMKYLIKLVTPPGGTVLDPFTGSGSTGCAAVELGHPYTGCELDSAYVEIAKKRIAAWYQHTRDPAKELFE